MPKYLTKLSIIAIVSTLAMPLQAQTPADAETVVATVNGTDITLGHMIMVRATLPEQYKDLPAAQLYEGIRSQLIQQTALAQSDDSEESLRVKLALENERRTLVASGVIEKIAADAVTDEAIKAAYDAQYADADLGQEFNASHILVETEEEAAAIVEELANGAEFGEVAREKSTGPSGPNGGELGWFSKGMMVEPFEVAVEGLESGAVSAPVETQFGWHVIKLNETRTMNAPDLDDVRAELTSEIQNAAVQSKMAEMVDEADVVIPDDVEIDAEALNDFSLIGN